MFILIIFTLNRQRSRRRGWSCGLRGGGGGGGGIRGVTLWEYIVTSI